MICLNEHFKKICVKCSFPTESTLILCKIAARIDSEDDFKQKFYAIRKKHMFPIANRFSCAGEKLKELAQEKTIHEYTLNLVFLIVCSDLLLKRFIKRGYSEELFWETMHDLRYKLSECADNSGVTGINSINWYEGFYNFKKFFLGRFQYAQSKFACDYTTKGNIQIKENTPCLALHIPSSGVSLSDEIRFESYKKAYEFYKNSDMIVDGNLIITCTSWILFPKHTEFLPEKSKILSFMNDFDIYSSSENVKFIDAWRIFGKCSELAYEQLPENTSLQRVYKSWLLSGNPTGRGTGVIVFDGEKIINK